MKYEIRKLSFVETWTEAINLYLDNFVSLFMIALISAFPLIMISQPSQAQGAEIPMENAAISLFIWLIALVSLSTLSAALLIEFISKRYLKRQQTPAQYIQNVLLYIFPMMGLAVIQAVVVTLGFMAMVIPGVYLALALSLAVETLIIERKGVIESMKRSFFLTRGKKLEIFFFTLVLTLVSLVLEKVMDFIFSMVDRSQMAVNVESINILFTQALLAPLAACVFILIYFNYRIEKEGFDPEHMVEQFASGSE
ncbi:MAG: hypothetical protein PVH61_18100 [Candidatus Aminicenantes bacterium]|jgi:hypothetical protein